ncbi:MAG: acyltransferase [Prevotella sp.]|nr:acyltransferase [Prevotella sp.]
MKTTAISTFPDSKPHYDILDGLRGVAAFIVIVYHVFECFDWSPVPHGYLSVDFFFVLSGFVIGYAYNNRWGKDLTTKGFFRRRLIRLHPMVIAGAIIGAICFILQGSIRWDGTHIGMGTVMLALLMSMFMIPLFPNSANDVRGNGEMFPLNGPHWSLFFEYIGNILYALLLRRLSTRWLAAIAVLSGCLLTFVALHDGYLGVGWTMADHGFWTGLIRMLFPYSIGMLMARVFIPMKIRNTFWICGSIIILVAFIPLFIGEMKPWMNGLYDAVCVILVFPSLVWIGASEMHIGKATMQISRFLGNLSYPLYAIHYPLMYLFYAHIGFHGDLVPIAKLHDVWAEAIMLPIGCMALAWICYRCYDLPMRKWLTKISISARNTKN